MTELDLGVTDCRYIHLQGWPNNGGHAVECIQLSRVPKQSYSSDITV